MSVLQAAWPQGTHKNNNHNEVTLKKCECEALQFADIVAPLWRFALKCYLHHTPACKAESRPYHYSQCKDENLMRTTCCLWYGQGWKFEFRRRRWRQRWGHLVLVRPVAAQCCRTICLMVRQQSQTLQNSHVAELPGLKFSQLVIHNQNWLKSF